MFFRCILFATAVLSVNAGSSYQFIRFPKSSTGNYASKPGKSAYLRTSRSFSHFPIDVFNNKNLLSDTLFLPPSSLVNFNHIPEGITEFSHDLTGVHDPYLLTGSSAITAVHHIYGSGELFFGQYPHVRQLLKNQEKRKSNGLAGNRLGSLRLSSPFLRHRSPTYFSWYI